MKRAEEMNMNTPEELITEENIRKLWNDELVRHRLEVRKEQINTKSGLAAMQAWISRARKNNTTSSLLTVGVHKIPRVNPESVQVMHYETFASKLEKDNPAIDFDHKLVEACLWRAIELCVKQLGCRGPQSQQRMETNAYKILSGATKYWENSGRGK